MDHQFLIYLQGSLEGTIQGVSDVPGMEALVASGYLSNNFLNKLLPSTKEIQNGVEIRARPPCSLTDGQESNELDALTVSGCQHPDPFPFANDQGMY